jgi:hypothetical protein
VILDKRRRIASGGWLVLLALILGLTTGIAWAHGGGVARLTNVEAGPYWVSVWTQPDPLRVGGAHVTVAVVEPGASATEQREAGPPVLDATVEVRFEPLDRAGEPLAALATHEGAEIKLLYEADVELPETGRWQVVITVEGPQGAGRARFEAQVAPALAVNWGWVGGGLGLVALAAVWLAQKFQTQRAGA